MGLFSAQAIFILFLFIPVLLHWQYFDIRPRNAAASSRCVTKELLQYNEENWTLAAQDCGEGRGDGRERERGGGRPGQGGGSGQACHHIQQVPHTFTLGWGILSQDLGSYYSLILRPFNRQVVC